MEAIKIDISVYKYGTFKENIQEQFKSNDDVLTWLSCLKEYSLCINEQSKLLNEDLSKYTYVFKYMDESYQLNVDV